MMWPYLPIPAVAVLLRQIFAFVSASPSVFVFLTVIVVIALSVKFGLFSAADDSDVCSKQMLAETRMGMMFLCDFDLAFVVVSESELCMVVVGCEVGPCMVVLRFESELCIVVLRRIDLDFMDVDESVV
ncbi:hypothetical protein Ddye_003004 [Dipteronia dyeriana]|uniref:Transmembrane protein n=1 Tax=Dipteronia dyeriana TaxID=168575 RepID=A0AAD9XS88_9ROSI|nr:hypothetical protein Ddye_003004 [Dipteronia dyeriana]